MKLMLRKELRLSLHPTAPMFLALSAMLLIPSYPYLVAFFYTGLAVFFTCLNGRENQDVFYSMLLPVAKRDLVTARTLFMVIFELAVLLLAVPFALLRQALGIPANPVGTEPGVAFFGLCLVQFAIFNGIFLPGFYRTGEKCGRPFLLACVAQFVYIGLVETSMHVVPYCKTVLDSAAPDLQAAQLPVLLAGMVLFAAVTWLACRSAQRRFARVDL